VNPPLAAQSSKFFLTPQLPIDAAGMDRHAEALSNALGQLRAGKPGFAEAELGYKLH
jgi:hypothetical protein